MTTEKLQELMQARMAYFGEHLSDERVTAQLKAYAANLGTVPDNIAEQAFLIALAKCKCLNYFLRDWTTAVRDIQLDALPSPERMWENALDTARSKAKIQAIFDKQPEAVRNYYGTPATQIKALTQSSRSELARNRYRGFVTAMDKAPVKALQAPPLPQLTQGIQPAAQIGDSNKSA